MSEPANASPPLGQVEEVADQVAAAVNYLLSRNGGRKIMLLGDSRGSVVAGVYAAREPGTISRLVLFAPVTSFTADNPPSDPPAYVTVTPKELWSVLSSWADANAGQNTLDPQIYDAWAETLLRSDPTSGTRDPRSVKIPNGAILDDVSLARGGFPYDPSKIQVPTLILMGETDAIATFPGAQWLLGRLSNASHRRLIVIGNASHTIQFEKERGEAYKAVAEFLHEKDE